MTAENRNPFSKNSVKKLGKRLRDASQPENEDILKLQEFRLSFKDTITEVFSILCEVGHEVNEDCICSFRIKRLDSIIRKLQRLRGDVELNSMGDIAGCRCILDKDDDVYKLMRSLKSCEYIVVSKVNIYMGARTAPSGYRSIHLYVHLHDAPNKKIELQLRTKKHHEWSTFVEMTDQIFGLKVKEGIKDYKNLEQHEEFEKLHQILSRNIGTLDNDERSYVLDVACKYDIAQRLDLQFIKNTVDVRRQWAEKCDKDINAFIISTGSDNIPQIDAYSDYSTAEVEYYNKFVNIGKSDNLVLVNMSNPTLEQINVAYSNYLLTYHNFTVLIYQLVRDHVFYADLNNVNTVKYVRYFVNCGAIVTKQARIEINSMKEKVDNAEFNEMSTSRRKFNTEWLNEITDRLGVFIHNSEIIRKQALIISRIQGEPNVIRRTWLKLRYKLGI